MGANGPTAGPQFLGLSHPSIQAGFGPVPPELPARIAGEFATQIDQLANSPGILTRYCTITCAYPRASSPLRHGPGAMDPPRLGRKSTAPYSALMRKSCNLARIWRHKIMPSQRTSEKRVYHP